MPVELDQSKAPAPTAADKDLFVATVTLPESRLTPVDVLKVPDDPSHAKSEDPVPTNDLPLATLVLPASDTLPVHVVNVPLLFDRSKTNVELDAACTALENVVVPTTVVFPLNTLLPVDVTKLPVAAEKSRNPLPAAATIALLAATVRFPAKTEFPVGPVHVPEVLEKSISNVDSDFAVIVLSNLVVLIISNGPFTTLFPVVVEKLPFDKDKSKLLVPAAVATILAGLSDNPVVKVV